jgi:hypothetical protein
VPGSERGGGARRWRGVPGPVQRHPWATAAVALLLASAAFVLLTSARPSYDSFGWLVWGRQALHWNLDTNGAPSWKPLPFLFTFPFALAGNGQMWLWMIAAVAGALGGAVFAGRIAYRLTGPSPERQYAPIAAAVIAGAAVLGIQNYWQLILIGNVDPMIMTLCLASVDSHLGGRRRVAFVLIVLAALGRPEVWPFAGLYGLWLWRAMPASRPLAVVGLAAIPLLWFGIPALTAHSWFVSGDLALNSKNALHGDKFTGVLGRFVGLYSWPMDVAALLALVLAAIRRDRTSLLLAGAAFVWVGIEIGFAYHGWSAVPRYMLEPAGVMIAVTGGGIGRVLAERPRRRSVLAWAGPAAVAVLLLALIPAARDTLRVTRDGITNARVRANQIRRLEAVIARSGGAARIKACGQPVTFVGVQSWLAWELGMNVGFVGYKPGKSISKGLPIVLFRPHGLGWEVRPIHTVAPGCASLKTDTTF